MKNILVCGAAGYIGSHMLKWLGCGHSVLDICPLATAMR
jgi:nucleoside-diphosphate-sugar epimerase